MRSSYQESRKPTNESRLVFSTFSSEEKGENCDITAHLVPCRNRKCFKIYSHRIFTFSVSNDIKLCFDHLEVTQEFVWGLLEAQFYEVIQRKNSLERRSVELMSVLILSIQSLEKVISIITCSCFFLTFKDKRSHVVQFTVGVCKIFSFPVALTIC